jgi:FMN reductase
MTSRRIAVVAGGVGSPSSTRMLADRLAAAVGSQLRARGEPAHVEIVELREHARALADAIVTGFAAGELRDAIRTVTAADAVVAVTPVFAGSYSGLFKTFVDVLDPDALAGTPVLLAATGGTARHSLVIEHAMRPLFSYLRALTVPTGVFAAPEDWAGGDTALLSARVDRAAGELADLLTSRSPAPAADPFDDPTPFETLLAQG